MQRSLVTLVAILCTTLCSACVTIQDINPFTPKPFADTGTVQGQFPHIFVPAALTLLERRSFVVQTAAGTKDGMQAWQGNVDAAELFRAMLQNMQREGWTLQHAVLGQERGMQIFERQGVQAVLTYARQPTSTIMEIWVASQTDVGAWTAPLPAESGNLSGVTPAYTPTTPTPAVSTTPTSSAGRSTGGLKERNLP